MDLIWVRHGEPVRIEPGRGVPADPPLTARGREQAQRLAAWLVHEPIDVLLSSPLNRARETAEPVAAALGLAVEIVDGIAEWDRDTDHYIPVEELRKTKDERWTAMVEGRWSEFGGDSPVEFTTRVNATVDEIVARFPGQRVVAVCHGGVINVALAGVLGLTQPLWFEPAYTSISRMAAARSGTRSIVSINDHAHLEATREDSP